MPLDLAIDLGTANTLVYARGRGIILFEPTVIALNSRTQDVLAMGNQAWHMIGRTPGHIVAVRPLRGGANGLHQSSAQTPGFQCSQPGNRRPAGTGDLISQNRRVQSSLEDHTGGPCDGLRRELQGLLTRQALSHSPVCQRLDDGVNIGRSTAAEAGNGIQ